MDNIEMFSTTRKSGLLGILQLLIVLACVILPTLQGAPAQAAVVGLAEAAEPTDATLRLVNRDIVTLRATLAGASPEVRVERARTRIREIPVHELDQQLTTTPIMIGETRGIQFLLGSRPLFTLVEGDVDAEAGQRFSDLVASTEARLIEARTAWHQTQDRQLLAGAIARAAVATLVFVVVLRLVYVGGRRLVVELEKKRDLLAARFDYVDWREFLGRIAVGTTVLLHWLLMVALVITWMRVVLASFVATRPLSIELSNSLWGRVLCIADGTLASLPGVFNVDIVLMLTRMLVDLVAHVLNAVEKKRLVLPLIHPETTSATRRILTLLTWGIGLAVAYPFLPGASSEAFTGLSVLFGLMLTLGSTGLVTQGMSGLVVVYSRALRKGDFVEVNNVQGVVSEVAALAVKIVNARNEEITIPNSVLIASPIHNYSKLAGSQGTLLTTRVTIGYDTPWRQVHAMLVAAARKTEGVREAPEPYVRQRALSDFYVEYDLFAGVDRPLERIAILSQLHANIQDEFNTHGVQIMSPHFMTQPDTAVMVPKDQWFAAPASAPAQDAPPSGR